MGRRRSLLLMLVITLFGCGDSATGPEASCIAVVNIDGVFYGPDDADAADPTAVATEPYLEITRNTGCLDEGQVEDPLAHGESNFLPVGTELHTIDGFDASERLAWWNDTLDEWSVLRPSE